MSTPGYLGKKKTPLLLVIVLTLIPLGLCSPFLARFFLIEAYRIPSAAMSPTLEVGDHLFVNRFLYGLMIPGTTVKILQWHHPQRGDVIVFKFPDDPSRDYIKRVVGLPGDLVEIRSEELYLNGTLQPVRYLRDVEVSDSDCRKSTARLYSETLDGGAEHLLLRIPEREPFSMAPVTVPEGRLFVMGDNRDNSADSAHSGYTVPFRNVKGKAMFLWLTRGPCGPARIGRVGHWVH